MKITLRVVFGFAFASQLQIFTPSDVFVGYRIARTKPGNMYKGKNYVPALYFNALSLFVLSFIEISTQLICLFGPETSEFFYF